MELIGVKYTQTVQPWMFGDGECKRTCFWLNGLLNLVPTNIVDGRGQSVHWCPPGPDRARMRSTTFPGIARAMAEQWGGSGATHERA